ncbi:MAG TPA: 50S ribosomal protein L10 [Thermoplasmatales archaeon]|nr:50S ribosomal protein L10 [Thermoplasmatales archaeon]
MAHVAEWKYKEVEQLKSIISSYPSVAIVGIEHIPAPQLQKMRENIREIGILRVSRNRLILRALEEVDENIKGIKELGKSIDGQSAILAANINPFKLYKFIKETRTNAPAKGGEIATKDIEVKAGETPFKPGPIVGELQKVGIPAAIEGGKVVIKKDKVLVKAGEKITPEVAQALTRLEIFPIEIGLDLKAVFEDGTVFTPDLLEIDVDKFLSDVMRAAYNAFALAIERKWITPQTIAPLITNAYRDALALSVSVSYPTKDNIGMLLSKAYAQATALKSIVDKNA